MTVSDKFTDQTIEPQRSGTFGFLDIGIMVNTNSPFSNPLFSLIFSALTKDFNSRILNYSPLLALTDYNLLLVHVYMDILMMDNFNQ